MYAFFCVGILRLSILTVLIPVVYLQYLLVVPLYHLRELLTQHKCSYNGNHWNDGHNRADMFLMFLAAHMAKPAIYQNTPAGNAQRQVNHLRTFSKHQTHFLQPAIVKVWEKMQQQLICQLMSLDEPVILGGDARSALYRLGFSFTFCKLLAMVKVCCKQILMCVTLKTFL